MRFRAIGPTDENTTQAPRQRITVLHELDDELTRACGAPVHSNVFRPARERTRARLRRGKSSIVDGPFTETKEMVGGHRS